MYTTTLLVWYQLVNLLLLGPAYSIHIDPSSLQCNGLTTPLGLATANPRLSWILTSQERDDPQTAYQIQATSDEAFRYIDLWDTEKAISSNTAVIYAGKALASRDRVFWRVRAWDADGRVGPWSSVTWFELALMQQSDWVAKWITNENYVTGKNGLPVFTKAFKTSCDPIRARLYYIGLGVQSATLNGRPVTDEVLLPSYSTMNTTLFYSSYDVAHQLRPGDNMLVVELGKGVYDAEKGLDGRYTKFIARNTPLPLKMLAQLEYICANGSKETVVSDNKWRTTTAGPLLESNWYGGEEYDARRNLSAARSHDSNNDEWVNANITTSSYPDLHPRLASPEMPPLKTVETFPCVSVTKTDVSYVFDFGQNFAGWYRFHFRGKSGQRITIWPAEILLKNGSADQSTTGSPIFDGYTFAGDGVETYSPKFMYHGFRYLEIFGLLQTPSKEDIVGHHIRIDALPTGQLDVSVPLFNDIHRIIKQSVQNQMYSVLTDCPTREKMGWLDQDNLAIAPVLFSYDFRAFGRHMMKQMRDAQNSIGEVPTTAPQLTEFGSWPPYGDGYDTAPNWGMSIVLFAWDHYVTYGDVEVLEDSYPAMKAYIDYVSRMNETTHIIWYGLGDWEAIDQTTPFGVTGTSAYARGVQTMAQIAYVLGRGSDARKYAELHSEILAAFQKTFFHHSSTATTYGSGSQACDAIALDIGAVPAEYIDAVYQHLEKSIRQNGTHVTVGEVGLPALIRVLSVARYKDLMYDLMSSTTYPSYGLLVEQGSTSITEYWDGPLGTGSQDHIILDGGDVWLYSLAGMKQAEGSVAWQKIDFDPVIVGHVKAAKTEFQSVRGLTAAAWELDRQMFTYDVTVPVNSQGTVYMPGSLQNIYLDGISIQRHPDVHALNQAYGDRVMIQIGSGTYSFISRQAK